MSLHLRGRRRLFQVESSLKRHGGREPQLVQLTHKHKQARSGYYYPIPSLIISSSYVIKSSLASRVSVTLCACARVCVCTFACMCVRVCRSSHACVDFCPCMLKSPRTCVRRCSTNICSPSAFRQFFACKLQIAMPPHPPQLPLPSHPPWPRPSFCRTLLECRLTVLLLNNASPVPAGRKMEFSLQTCSSCGLKRATPEQSGIPTYCFSTSPT